MVKSSEQLRVKALLTEAITVLCKNGLRYRREFSVEGLLGITLDNEDVFLININETVREPGDSDGEEVEAAETVATPPQMLKQERVGSPVEGRAADKPSEVKHIPPKPSPPRNLPLSPGQRARNRRRSGESSPGSPAAKRKAPPRPSESSSPIDSKDDIIVIKEERLSDMEDDTSSQTDLLSSSSLHSTSLDQSTFLQQNVFNQSLQDSSYLHEPSDSNTSFQDTSGNFGGPGCSSWDPSMMALAQPVPIEGSLTQNQVGILPSLSGLLYMCACCDNMAESQQEKIVVLLWASGRQGTMHFFPTKSLWTLFYETRRSEDPFLLVIMS